MLSLLILGDSLAFPRPAIDGAARDPGESWPVLLASQVGASSFWMRAAGQSSVLDVQAEVRHLAAYLATGNVDLTCVQVGIVDAAPRAYPRRLSGFFGSQFMRHVCRPLPQKWHPSRNPLMLKLCGRPWVSHEVFARNIHALVEQLSGFSHEIFLIQVQEPGPRLTELLGEFTVSKYNFALQDAARLSDRVHFVEYTADLLPDGHHLTLGDQLRLCTELASLAQPRSSGEVD